MNDRAFGHAADARPRTLPGLAETLERLFTVGSAIGRGYDIRKGGYEVVIFREDPRSPIRIGLPTIIRGRLVANYLELAHLELEKPIEPEEVSEGEP
jgi:hypothetical protein